MPSDAQVVVVGAGPAGLSIAGALERVGVRCAVLERDAEIGERWTNRYDRLRLHTVRRFSGLAHHPMPGGLPRYVTKDEFAAYLRDYATHLGLDVHLRQVVTHIRPEAEGWAVETKERVWRAPAVVLATGRHDRPVIPDWPGLDRYRGRLLHSHDYRSGAEFRGRDVLVVGLGNSGAEIAAELAQDGARRVSVAVRTPPPITRRDVLGIPIQLLGILGSFLPASVGDRLGSVLRRLGTGNLSRYGLGPAEWGPFSARRPPVIDVGFLGELRSGRIEILPALERLTADAVVFVGGREERFDAVIAATGFRSCVPELLGLPAPDDEHPSRNGLPTHLPPGVHVVGFRESVRGVLFETRRDSLRLAGAIARELAARGSSPAR